MAFRTAVLDAVDEWDELLRERVGSLRRNDPNPDSDEFRCDVLKELHEQRCVSFRHWRAEEVLVFVLVAFPRSELLRLTASGMVSTFFDLLYCKWNPSFLDWIHLLWRFTGEAHEFFADLLFLLPSKQRAPYREMGRVLFREVFVQAIIPHKTASSVIGALIEWPLERTMVIKHANRIFDLSLRLSPEETGFVCRSLIMYRAREVNANCDCGYERGEKSCVCSMRYIRNNYTGKKGMDLEHDRDKEYACAMCRIIIELHEDYDNTAPSNVWSEEQADQFIRSTCDEVFSEEIYIELFQNLRKGRMPHLRPALPRALSSYEKKNNASRAIDGDYNHGFAQHAGCVTQNCKQAWKTGCRNTSCSTHCLKTGRLPCQVHRNMEPLGTPSYPKRKGIAPFTRRRKNSR